MDMISTRRDAAPRAVAPGVAPTLVTARLILRPHAVDDLDACAALWADPEVVRHITGRPSSRQDTWFRMLRYAGLWSLVGYGYWALIDRASGELIGEAGFGRFLREIASGHESAPGPDEPEAGWIVAPEAAGRGLATEAMKAAFGWLEDARADASTACLIDPANRASLRVAEKLGYRRTGTAEGPGWTSVALRRPRGGL